MGKRRLQLQNGGKFDVIPYDLAASCLLVIMLNKQLLSLARTYAVAILLICAFHSGSAHAQATLETNQERANDINRILEYNPEQGRIEAEAFLADALEANDALGAAQAQLLIGQYYLNQSEPETALIWYTKARDAIEPEDDAQLYLRILTNIGGSYNNMGDLEKAYRNDVIALDHAERYGELVEVSRIKLNMAIMLINSYFYAAAAEILEPLLEDDAISRHDRIWVTQSLALSYWGIGENSRSLETFEQAAELLQEEDSHNEWLAIYVPYSRVLIELGEYDRAAKIVSEGLSITGRTGNRANNCRFRGHNIRIQSGLGQFEQAIDLHTEYQALCEAEFSAETARIWQEVELLPSVISAYQAAGQTSKANTLMARLIESQARHFENILSSRVEIERHRLETEVAETQIKYLEQRDALNSATIDRQNLLFVVGGLVSLFLLFAVSFFGYGYVKKSRSNKTLEDNTRQIRNRARTAEKEVAYKDLLIQEINHRVKNNIQSIIAILNIHRRQIGSTATEATIDILNDVSNRFLSLAAYQHSLEIVDGVEETSAQSLITKLSEGLIATSDASVDLSLDIDDVKFPSEQAAPLALIVNELISNSLKHGLRKRGGNMRISLKQDAQRVHLTCADNGTGLPANFDEKDSLGVMIVRSLTRKLNGKVAFIRLQPGTEVKIDFPRTGISSNDLEDATNVSS